ncbi:hypothetical protein B0H19DRAFT_1081012 [Mycena capillaripes]|nr:hypothetical protein B0H19DRAFT_1081012 [Mycena capillaripes]
MNRSGFDAQLFLRKYAPRECSTRSEHAVVQKVPDGAGTQPGKINITKHRVMDVKSLRGRREEGDDGDGDAAEIRFKIPRSLKKDIGVCFGVVPGRAINCEEGCDQTDRGAINVDILATVISGEWMQEIRCDALDQGEEGHKRGTNHSPTVSSMKTR